MEDIYPYSPSHKYNKPGTYNPYDRIPEELDYSIYREPEVIKIGTPSMPASLTCPFDAKDLPLARAAAEEAGLQYEEITDLAVASQAYIKTGYEKGARFPEVYGSTAQQYIEKGGAVVRLTRTDEDHNFSKFWEILNAARGTK